MTKKRDTPFNSKKDIPLSPSLPVETNSDYDAHIQEYISKIIGKFPKETKKNRLSVGEINKYILYQPHNYRLYIDFDKASFNPKPSPNQAKKLGCYPFTIKNSKEFEFDNFFGCRIRVKKTQVEITNKVELKWYRIFTESSNKILKQFKGITEQKDKECIDALRKFIEIFGGYSSFSILNRHSEDKIKQETAINRIPKSFKWHGDISKKVYNEHNVEFPTPVVACNYVENRGLESFSPQIADSLKAIVQTIEKQSKNIQFLAENINSHIPAIVKLGNAADRLSNNVQNLSGADSRGRNDLAVSRKTTPKQKHQVVPFLCPICNNLIVIKGRNLRPFCSHCGGFLT